MVIVLCAFCFIVYLVMQSLNPHFGKGCGMLIILIALGIPVALIISLFLSVAIPFIFATLPYLAFLVAVCWVVKRLTKKACS